MQHSLKLEAEARNLIACGIRTQGERDRLLYSSFNDLNCLYSTQHYGTLPRMVLDRQINLGADINAAVGDKGETLLFHVCDQINKAFVGGETDVNEAECQHQENAEVFHVRVEDLVLSLIKKGADPRTSIHDDWTPYHVLKRDTHKATSMKRAFLLNLILQVEKARDEFLKIGSRPSVFVKKANILDLTPSDSESEGAMSSLGQRVNWSEGL